MPPGNTSACVSPLGRPTPCISCPYTPPVAADAEISLPLISLSPPPHSTIHLDRPQQKNARHEGLYHTPAATVARGVRLAVVARGRVTAHRAIVAHDDRSRIAAHPQVPGSSTFRSPACGATASGALDAAGALLLWGTDTSFHGALTDRLGQQARAPTPVGSGSFRSLAVGFAAAAAVTPHDRLATWGWSGYAQEVGLSFLPACNGDSFPHLRVLAASLQRPRGCV